MKLALCSDEPYPIHDELKAYLSKKSIAYQEFGSFLDQKNHSWVTATEEACKAILKGQCQEGIFFCWTGTGASLAASKISGIRAALCIDPETAIGSRIWNHSNVLCLSNRLMSGERMIEIVDKWLHSPWDAEQGREGINELERLEKQNFQKR